MMTSSERWRIGGPLPRDLTPMQVQANPDGSGWIFGWQGPANPEERQGVIVGITAQGQVQSQWHSPGWVRSGHLHNGTGFAVWAQPGPRFTLLHSSDGNHWEDYGPIPAKSITQVLSMGPQEAWLLGADHLLRWQAGQWTHPQPPQAPDSSRDRLLRVADQLILATPTGLYLPRKEGQQWGHRGVEGAHIRSLSYPYISALHNGRAKVGRLEGAFVEWLGHIEGPGDPIQLGWQGGQMQLALIPHDLAQHPGILHINSRPEGGFETCLLNIPPQEGYLGLAGAHGLLAVAADRRLLQAGS